MAKPTERALKRKPMAVILLTTRREDVPNVPDGAGGREFEWFASKEGMHAYFDQNNEYHQQDTKDHDDMAYMCIEITDTASDPMTLGRVEAHPETDETKAWLKSIKDDPTKAFQPVKEAKEEATSSKVVRPRRKSSAAAAVQKDDSKTKAARLKERLAAKQGEDKKSETGDKPPAAAKPSPPKKAAAKEPDIVVKKAATSPS